MSEIELVKIIQEMDSITLENLLMKFRITDRDAYNIFVELVQDAD